MRVRCWRAHRAAASAGDAAPPLGVAAARGHAPAAAAALSGGLLTQLRVGAFLDGTLGRLFLPPSAMAAPATEPVQQPARSFELPLTDVTLRAGADGATVRVHRGELGLHSRIFLELLTKTESPVDALPLPGKTGEDLALLTAFMYPRRSRDEGFKRNNISRLCEMGREYDMQELLAAIDDWLVVHAAELMLPASGGAAPQQAGTVLQADADCT